MASPLDERVKTDVRFPERVLRDMNEQCVRLGIPKNAFITMAICCQIVAMSPFMKGQKKRMALLRNVETLFQKTIAEAREASE